MDLSHPSAPPAANPCPSPAETDETALVRQAAGGDERAFETLVNRHGRRVFNFLHQLTRHRQDAEDLTQRTFIKAYQGLGRIDPEQPLINWLFTIARRTALNHFRDTRRWEEIPEDSAAAGDSPARQAEEREGAANIWTRARAALSQREFEVLWLRFGEELSTEETARAAGLTAANVKVIVFRARQQLLKGDISHE